MFQVCTFKPRFQFLLLEFLHHPTVIITLVISSSIPKDFLPTFTCGQCIVLDAVENELKNHITDIFGVLKWNF